MLCGKTDTNYLAFARVFGKDIVRQVFNGGYDRYGSIPFIDNEKENAGWIRTWGDLLIAAQEWAETDE